MSFKPFVAPCYSLGICNSSLHYSIEAQTAFSDIMRVYIYLSRPVLYYIYYPNAPDFLVSGVWRAGVRQEVPCQHLGPAR